MLLTNVKIYTMNEDKIIANGYIHIKDGKIEDVGKMEDLSREDEEVLNLEGRSVYPGFVDAHTHLGLFEDSLTFEGDDGNEDNDPITPQLRALDGINPMDKYFKEAVSAGITTVIVGPGSSNAIGGELVAIKTYGRCIDKMIVKENVGIKFALGENPKGTYSEKNQSPSTRMATAALIREQLNKARRYNEDKTNTILDEESEPPEYDAKCEALIPLLDGEVSAHFHVHRADDIFTAIRIAKEFDIKYVLVHATEGHLVLEELKEENASILSGPFLSDRSKPELVNLTPKAPGLLSNNGLMTAIITDHPETPINYLTLCAAIAVKEGMDKYEAIKAITINPAKICNIDDRVGSIEVGKDADLVVYKDSIFDIMSRPEFIICCGKCLNI